MNKNPNFFKKVAYSFVPPKYGEICLQKKGALTGFVFLLSLFLLVGNSLNFYLSYKSFLEEQGVENFRGLVDKYVPDFTISDGKLNMSEAIDFSAGESIVHIDSNSDSEITMSDVEYLVNQSKFRQFVLGSSRNLVIYDNRQGKYSELKFSDIDDTIKSKQDLIEMLQGFLKIGWIIGLIGVYLFLALGYFLKALLYFIVFRILNAFLKRKIMNGNIYEVAVYAVLPATLLDFILTLLQIQLPTEAERPLYFIVTLLLGAFGMFSVHEAIMKKMNEGTKYKFDNNPYRYSGFVPDDSASIADENFGGYTAIAGEAAPNQTYSQPISQSTKIRVRTVELERADLEFVDRYVKANLKDMAAQQLEKISGLSFENCLDVINNWEQYYH